MVPLARRSTGVAFGFPSLVSVVLSFAVHATLVLLRATLDPWPSGVLYGSSRGAPHMQHSISPFIVVQLTLNLTINP